MRNTSPRWRNFWKNWENHPKHIEVIVPASSRASSPTKIHPVNLQEVRKTLGELREGIKRIRQELTDHFANPEQSDKYGKQMWNFVGKATAQLEDLVDDVNAADSTFTEVVGYYGEDDKNMSSSEFYGIFKTFVTSYKVRILIFEEEIDAQHFYRNAKLTIKLPHKRRQLQINVDKRPKKPGPFARKLWKRRMPRRPRIPPNSTTSSRSCGMGTAWAGAHDSVGGVPQNLESHSYWKLRFRSTLQQILATRRKPCWQH